MTEASTGAQCAKLAAPQRTVAQKLPRKIKKHRKKQSASAGHQPSVAARLLDSGADQRPADSGHASAGRWEHVPGQGGPADGAGAARLLDSLLGAREDDTGPPDRPGPAPDGAGVAVLAPPAAAEAPAAPGEPGRAGPPPATAPVAAVVGPSAPHGAPGGAQGTRPLPNWAVAQAYPADGAAPGDASPADRFDAVYARHAQRIAQHAYLLSGDANIARRAVAYGFRLAWERWPEVAVDPDPGGWVRAAAGEYALSPWHRFRPRRLWHRLRQKSTPETEFDGPGPHPPRHPAARALLTLHPGYRRCVVLHDVLRLGLPEIAAEAEATTAATAARLAHAHQALAERLPVLRSADPADWSAALGRLLEEAAAALPDQTLPPPAARKRAARAARLQILGTLALLALLTGAVALGFG